MTDDHSRTFPTSSIGYFRLALNPEASDKSAMDSLLKRRVSERIGVLKTNAFEVARAAGFERNYVNDILNDKKSSVRGPNLLALANALRCSADYLIREASEPPDDENPDPQTVSEQPVSDARSDLVEVPEYDVRLSAGAGFVIDTENVKDVWQFSRRYLVDEMRLNPRTLGVVEVEGDSMFPTLWSGDRVIVDYSDTNAAKPGVYAIWDSDVTVVKRIEKIPATNPVKVVLIPDNKNHHEYTVRADQVRIIGRVVWFARRL